MVRLRGWPQDLVGRAPWTHLVNHPVRYGYLRGSIFNMGTDLLVTVTQPPGAMRAWGDSQPLASSRFFFQPCIPLWFPCSLKETDFAETLAIKFPVLSSWKLSLLIVFVNIYVLLLRWVLVVACAILVAACGLFHCGMACRAPTKCGVAELSHASSWDCGVQAYLPWGMWHLSSPQPGVKPSSLQWKGSS